jgi:hypothetical protein
MARFKRAARYKRTWRVLVRGVVALAQIIRPEIRSLRSWQQTLVAQLGSRPARRLSAALQRRYTALLAQQPAPEHPRLRWHLTDQILPGLALYQVLLAEHSGDRLTALGEMDRLLRARTLTQYRFMRPLRGLPMPFWLFRLAYNLRMRSFPPQGWDFETVQDDPDCLAFNTYRCFYLETLTRYGAPELTASFCKTDEVLAEWLPSNVRFVRSQTLGQGGGVCDFQYCRIKRSNAAS